jgi:pyroglutamyl-peptidase
VVFVKVLLTGFEPFRKEKVNPSWEVCRRISEKKYDNTEIVVKQLPVVFDEAREKAVQYCRQIQPDVILLLGEAGGRTHISVERIAINCDNAPKDNKGQKRDNQIIEKDGNDGYFATIPVKKILRSLERANIPAVVSNSAGTYLCNHVLYGMLHYVKKNNLQIKVGFIHVPYLPEQTVKKPGKASMSLDLMAKAVETVIQSCE